MRQFNLEKIFINQRKLDQYIHKNHKVCYKNIIEELKLAFCVELSELANEVRCFKFWSFKKPSDKEIILEEYVDGIHFITSLCIAFNVSFKQIGNINSNIEKMSKKKLTKEFLKIYKYSSIINDKKSVIKVFNQYIELGLMLDFNYENILAAYMKKCKINYKRQDNNY